MKNSGKTEGKEVVQLYVADLCGISERPVKELKGFAKVHLLPGEEKTVSMEQKRKMQLCRRLGILESYRVWINRASCVKNIVKYGEKGHPIKSFRMEKQKQRVVQQ